jgi:hypothetical protein
VNFFGVSLGKLNGLLQVIQVLLSVKLGADSDLNQQTKTGAKSVQIHGVPKYASNYPLGRRNLKLFFQPIVSKASATFIMSKDSLWSATKAILAASGGPITRRPGMLLILPEEC